MKLKIILLIALSLAGMTQAYAKSHKSKHAHHRGHQWVVPSKSMCERYGGTWKPYKHGCEVTTRAKAIKMCRVIGARLASLSDFRRLIVGCGGGFMPVAKKTPYNARDIGYPYTSCVERGGISTVGEPYYWTSNIRNRKYREGIQVNPAYGDFQYANIDSDFLLIGCIR